MDSKQSPKTSRRGFFEKTATVTAAASVMAHSSVQAAEEKQEIRLGIVGCGGRGTGAIDDSLSINENVKVVAAADLNAIKCESLRKLITRRHPEKIDLVDAKLYSGLDSYKRILDDKDIDVVLMTTSPAFRPRYVFDAVDAGKHVFAEKPTCVDAEGYRICLEAHDNAKANGTAIVTGTQYRRQTSFIEAVKKIRAGEIGDIVHAQTRYCSTGIWYKVRKEGMSDTQYQLYNWMHYIWLSGDQIVEQAIHNIDAMNWVMGSPPDAVYGSGGRFTRPEASEMWDSMSLDYEYPGGKTLSFKCRQIPGSAPSNGSIVFGTKGVCHIGSFSNGSYITDMDGNKTWEIGGDIGAAYKQEHKDLIDSIRSGSPIVELKQTAESSLTGVMGRMAAYTGQRVTWDFATKSKLDLYPKDLSWDGALPEPRHAIPGVTELI